MAKSCNQKGKILYLQKMLSETTSQKPVTMQEILAKQEEQGIRAERKSIYDDMETLRDFGMDIHYIRGREGGYYEEKSASDKTEADNTIIHQPDGETGEKSENVQEQIGKESEAPVTRSLKPEKEFFPHPITFQITAYPQTTHFIHNTLCKSLCHMFLSGV